MKKRFFRNLLSPGIIREGRARRVVFYYQEEVPTYLENPYVRLYRSGLVDIDHPHEKLSTHLSHVEITWTEKYSGPKGKLGDSAEGKVLRLIPRESRD